MPLVATDKYFYIKTHFGIEKYLEINNFKIRQSICKIRVSAHSLTDIETDQKENAQREILKMRNILLSTVPYMKILE